MNLITVFMIVQNFFITFGLVFFLSACSLEPVFKNATNTKDINQYNLLLKLEYSGYHAFKLKNILERKKGLIEGRLTQNSILKIKISEEFMAINIAQTGDSNRNNGRIIADITLHYTHPKTQEIIEKTARLDCISSYDLDIQESFASTRTKDSTRNRLLESLSDEIIRTTLYLVD